MEKIILNFNKILKITNVLIFEMYLGEGTDINKLVFQMENYIKSKGATPM